jgi:UDP-N-acetylenolpyruvoylglucosamine reductase
MMNYGNATAREIVQFAALVRQRVYACFGVSLIPEVRLIGFDGTAFGEAVEQLVRAES